MRIDEATLLVVDDEPELLEIFSIWLGRIGCKVLTAANGAEGLKILTTQKVDALISDIRMPIMDGMTLVRRLYELNVLIPSIIFVSGFGDIDVRDAHALGVEAMLSKPLSRQSLLHSLECSLKDRSELWREPEQVPPGQTVSVEFQSLEESKRDCSFLIGRGGCCFLSPVPLVADTHVNLHIRFASDGAELNGQGKVNWYSAEDGKVGVQFSYLEAGCRDWVIEQMRGKAQYSFIPRCAAC